MTKLDAALLKLEGALDQTIDPRVRALIDVAQQAIEAAKYVIMETPHRQKGERMLVWDDIHGQPDRSTRRESTMNMMDRSASCVRTSC
ncbi:MAG: hypothetical protein ABIU05_18235 [Nitrospirales bacterium]